MPRPPLIPVRDLLPAFRPALDAHASPEGRAALRAGLEGAVAVCDLIAKKIEGDHLRGGRVTRRGQKKAEGARQCADTIWSLRDGVGAA